MYVGKNTFKRNRTKIRLCQMRTKNAYKIAYKFDVSSETLILKKRQRTK